MIVSSLLRIATIVSPLEDQTVDLDTSLLIPWDQHLLCGISEEGGKAPQSSFSVSYEKHAKKLTFVASCHGVGLENCSHQKVREAVESLHPEVVIVEGLPSSGGINNPEFLAMALKGAETNFTLTGENLYSIFLAHTNNCSFIAAEPDDAETMLSCLKGGYSPMDVIGYYIIRQIPQCKIEKILNDPFDSIEFEDFALTFAHDCFDKEIPFSLPEFYHWYEQTTGVLFDCSSIDYSSFENLPENHLFTRLSIDINNFRDQHIAEVMSAMCKQFNRVLVVYGSYHYPIHRLVLEQAFGLPKKQS